MSAINKGTTCLYGIEDGQEASLFVQSYTVTSNYNNTATVVDEQGKTVTLRYDDIRSEITIEGVARSASIPQLGATLTFNVNTNSAYPGGGSSSNFSGTVIKVDDRGSSKGYTSVSVTAESYEYVAS